MSQWIQTTNANLRSIKVDGLSDDVWFTDQQYSEVTQSVADLLAAEIDSISKVSEPGTPGDYYESDYDGTTLNVSIDSDPGPFSDFTVTGTVSAGTVDSQTISTDEANIRPLKIGYLTDLHWGSTYGSFGSRNHKQTLLDEFATDMNDWGADYVVFGGDNTHEEDTKSGAQQNITDLRNYVEPKLNAPVKPIWGNHEYVDAGSYGEDWSYGPWGISSTSDTYYSIDHHHAKLIVLNTGYDPGDNNYSGVPAGQFDWLKTELDNTTKPVVIFTHTPPHLGGAKHEYDSIGVVEGPKYTKLFESYDNIALITYGHSHHESMTDTMVPATFNHSFIENSGGRRYLYQHYPHGLGGSNTNNNGFEYPNQYPWGKIHIYQNGNVNVQQSYSGESTGYRGNWTVNGGTAPQSRAHDYLDTLTAEFTPDIADIHYAGDRDLIEGNGAITLQKDNSGPSYIELNSGPNDGDLSVLRFKRLPMMQSVSEEMYWPDMVWTITGEIETPDNVTVQLYRGDVADHRLGFVYKDGQGAGDGGNEWFVEAYDGVTLGSRWYGDTTGKFTLQMRLDSSRQKCTYRLANGDIENGNGKRAHGPSDGVPEPTLNNGSAETHQLTATIKNSGAASSRKLRIYDWSCYLSPDFDITV